MATMRVPALTREEGFRSVQPLESAWTNVKTDLKSLVPAPMREDAIGGVQPLDTAWTNHANWSKLFGPRSQT